MSTKICLRGVAALRRDEYKSIFAGVAALRPLRGDLDDRW